MKLLAIVLSPSLCRHIRHPKTEQNKTIAQSPQNTPNIHHMIICPNRLLHCKILYIDHYRNIVPRFETKSLSLNALMWAKKNIQNFLKTMSHLVTHITDQKEAWQQSQRVSDVSFCNAPINHQCNLRFVCKWRPPPCWLLAVVERTQSHLGSAGMLVSWRSLLPYLTISLNLAHSAGNIDGGTNKNIV